MKRNYILILSIIMLSACKQETPNCSSSDAKKVVLILLRKN